MVKVEPRLKERFQMTQTAEGNSRGLEILKASMINSQTGALDDELKCFHLRKKAEAPKSSSQRPGLHPDEPRVATWVRQHTKTRRGKLPRGQVASASLTKQKRATQQEDLLVPELPRLQASQPGEQPPVSTLPQQGQHPHPGNQTAGRVQKEPEDTWQPGATQGQAYKATRQAQELVLLAIADFPGVLQKCPGRAQV